MTARQDQQTNTRWIQLTAGARLAQVSRMTLHRALVGGELPYAVVGGERFVLLTDVQVWAEQRRQTRAGDPSRQSQHDPR
jgi:hypothetical protein